MGSREQNFYNGLGLRMGYEEAAREVQDLYLARQHREAAAAVPFEFIDRTSLLGPLERIRDRLAAYRRGRRHDAGRRAVRRHAWRSGVGALRTVAEALDESGLGDVRTWCRGSRPSCSASCRA